MKRDELPGISVKVTGGQPNHLPQAIVWDNRPMPIGQWTIVLDCVGLQEAEWWAEIYLSDDCRS